MMGEQANGGGQAGDRRQRIHRLLDEVLRRRARGENLPDEKVLAEHPELMPELVGELRALDRIEQARRQAGLAPPPREEPQAGGDGPPPDVPGYRIERELGRGGMGCVYLAEELSTRRKVALKVMLADRYADQRQRRRFEREVEIAASLEHPNIARLYASGLHEGHHWFAMEYVEGRRLDDFLAHEKVGLRARLALFAAICDAVAYAHQRGVIHRDLKPGNILVDAQARPRVLDFGLAKSLLPAGDGQESISISQEVMGTPAYMSPEQVAGDPAGVDVRSDVYALGVVLYRMLTGRGPYGDQTTSLHDLMTAIRQTDPIPPRRVRKDIPDEPSAIVLKALEKDPARRYQSAAELAADVRAYLHGQAVTAKQGSGLYMLRKLAARHKKTAFAIAAVVVLSLGLGTVMSALFAKTRIEVRQVVRKVDVLRDEVIRLGGDPNQALARALADAADPAARQATLPAHVRVVRALAKPGGDGRSWASAHADLQDALAVARQGQEIWVAAGTYTPDRGTGDRGASFHLKSGVALYGGFTGTEVSRDQRDPNKYQTILGGDLKRDDRGPFLNAEENSLHVVTASSVDANAVLDSFIITGGNATRPANAASMRDDTGGGLFAENSSVHIVRCEFAQNQAASRGGAAMVSGGGPTFANCMFRDNKSGLRGGGVMSENAADPRLIGCTFDRNSAAENGGGVAHSRGGNMALTGCTFRDNLTHSRDGGGGGLDCEGGALARLSGCEFRRNRGRYGGAIRNRDEGRTEITRCEFAENTTAIQNEYHARSTIKLSRFTRNQGGIGAVHNTHDADMVILNCDFVANIATNVGGGGITNGEGRLTLVNSRFVRNVSREVGGLLKTSAGPRYWAKILNCTFYGNRGEKASGGLHLWEGPGDGTQLVNCIIWGNQLGTRRDEVAQIYCQGGRASAERIARCRVQGWTGQLGGEGNSGANPLFADPNGPDGQPGTEDDDLRLRPGSPCIDAGEPNALPPDSEDLDGDGDTTEPIPADLAGSPRVVGGKVDIGAYEFQTGPSARARRTGPIFVNAKAAGRGDGTSWSTAYADLQDALSVAESGHEIWVAAGTYKPDGGTGDRAATFRLKGGVAIYGGFAGGETSSDQRDPKKNETILSGDLKADDGPDFANREDNSLHVVTSDSLGVDVTIDGFTIAGGNANRTQDLDKWGSAILLTSGTIHVRRCVFTQNRGADGGTAYIAPGAEASFADCVFRRNLADHAGAGFRNHGGQAKAVNCLFIANRAGTGPGVYNQGTLLLVNCRFMGNRAGLGTAIRNLTSFRLRMVNCVLTGNVSDAAVDDGGVIHSHPHPGSIGEVDLTNCTIACNPRSNFAIISVVGTNLRLANCVIWGNASGAAGRQGPEVVGRGSVARLNWFEGNPVFADPNGPDGKAGTEDDDLRLMPGSPCIDAGEPNSLPPDSEDLDGDGDTTEPIPVDLAGSPRVVGGKVDIGAYEFQAPGPSTRPAAGGTQADP